MKDKYNITITGAGITGLTCAALLSKGRHASKFKIKIIDANPRPIFSLKNDISMRVSAISNGSIRGKLQSIKTRRYNNTLLKRSSVDGSFAYLMTLIFLVY